MGRRRKRKYRGKSSRPSRRERQIQLIIRTVSMVLALCLVLLVILIIQGIRGGQEDQQVSQEISAAQDNSTQEQDLVVDEMPVETDVPEDIQITISAAGDSTLGSDDDFDDSISFDTMYQNVGDPGYFLQNVKAIFEADDLTILNLEGPLTTSQDEQEKTFAFHGSPSYMEILTSGSVEAVNLANNHSHDYGEQGYEDTISNVEGAGIASFGYDRNAVVEIKGVKVGLVGIYVLADGMERETQLKEQIAAVKEQGAVLVIVSFHWGSEKEYYPDSIQVSLAHTAVDEGADLVLGHHPHVLQGIEHYNGKNIVYSLGNFCFGGNSNPDDKDTMIFQQTFTIQQGAVVTDSQIEVIPCSISSESGYNNYQPTPAEGEEKERIQERIDSLSEGL